MIIVTNILLGLNIYFGYVADICLTFLHTVIHKWGMAQVELFHYLGTVIVVKFCNYLQTCDNYSCRKNCVYDNLRLSFVNNNYVIDKYDTLHNSNCHL